MSNAAKYYAVADMNGPISVRIDAETVTEAREWFLTQDADDFGNICRTDAEDDLGVCGEGMTRNEWEEIMEDEGYEIADRNLCGEYIWTLWERN